MECLCEYSSFDAANAHIAYDAVDLASEVV